MIAHLRGTVASLTSDAVIIDVAGVGYLVQMTTRDLSILAPRKDEVFVHVLTHVRDGAMTLFGFLEPTSREVFNRLISLSGVGPKLGLSILSTLTLQELWDAAQLGNTAGLRRIPGVGPKTARRLALELKDLLAKVESNLQAPPPIATLNNPSSGPPANLHGDPVPNNMWRELHSGLTNLGFDEALIDGTIAQLRRDRPEETELEVLFREALAQLRRPASSLR